MKLHHPIVITPRLLPGVRVGDAWISIEWSKRPGDHGSARCSYYLDLPGGVEHTNDDLQSGFGRATLQEMLGTLLAFLGAAAESFRYAGRTGENSNLFPLNVTEWAAANSDEISSLQYEIEETPNLITA